MSALEDEQKADLPWSPVAPDGVGTPGYPGPVAPVGRVKPYRPVTRTEEKVARTHFYKEDTRASLPYVPATDSRRLPEPTLSSSSSPPKWIEWKYSQNSVGRQNNSMGFRWALWQKWGEREAK